MKKELTISVFVCLTFFAMACNQPTANTHSESVTEKATSDAVGQSGVKDDLSAKNVVQIAIASKDHSTLVKAVKAAELVDALSNAGPFTVFAPTNAAFEKLPAGTVEELLKPGKKDELTDILQYHVSIGVFKTESLQDGQTLGQVNGGSTVIHIKDGKTFIDDAQIVASVPASNGIVHVIDGVLIPKK